MRDAPYSLTWRFLLDSAHSLLQLLSGMDSGSLPFACFLDLQCWSVAVVVVELDNSGFVAVVGQAELPLEPTRVLAIVEAD